MVGDKQNKWPSEAFFISRMIAGRLRPGHASFPFMSPWAAAGVCAQKLNLDIC